MKAKSITFLFAYLILLSFMLVEPAMAWECPQPKPGGCYICQDGVWVPYGNCWGGCPACSFCSSCWCTTCQITGIGIGGDPDNHPLGMYVTFGAISIPSGCAGNYVNWSGGGEPATQQGGNTFVTKWTQAGKYTVTLSGCGGNFTKDVNIFDVDLVITGLTEEEENAGKYIGINNDDDNGNEVPDKDESGPVVNEDDLAEIEPSIEPELHSGTAALEVFWEGANNPIKIWETSEKGTELIMTQYGSPAIKIWDLSQETLPEKLYVEGYRAGEALFMFYYGYFFDIDWAGFTVVELILSAYDLDGVVSDANEENPGAYVHFNLDNDNSSNNSVGAPKHPGGDYLETSSSVSGEDDLKLFGMFLYPWSLNIGTIILNVPPGAKVWKSATKGSSNLVFSPGEYTWDLSNQQQQQEFQNHCSTTLYVEGWMYSMGYMKLRYIDPLGNCIKPEEIIKYNFIAADCGRQPKTSGSLNERDFATDPSNFPSLVHCEWSITAEASTLYNCIAFSVDETNIWYNKAYIAQNYGDKDGVFEETDMDDFYYQKKGWSLITSGTDEEKADQAEAMYYSEYHAARKKSCGCGAGNWIIYESKCGSWVRMEHVWDQLNNPVQYGTPIRFYK